MNFSDDEALQSTAVVCPVCRTRFDAPLQDGPGQAKCPDCFSTVRVPSRQEALAARPKKRAPTNPGTYQIAVEEVPQRPPKPDEPEFGAVRCPHCGTRLTPELRDRAYNVTCPDCLEVIEVPAGRDWRRKHKRRRKRPAEESGGYALSAETPPAPPTDNPPPPAESPSPQPDVLGALAEIRREAPPPVPKLTFFSGVFSLPWRPEVRARWVYLSLGFVLLGMMTGVMHWVVAQGFYVAIPCFALPIFWFAIWTGSFGTSSFLTIVEDTANGNDRIAHWNDGGWRDWAFEALGPFFLGGVACSAGFGLGRLAVAWGGEAAYWPVFCGVVLLLYPVMLLSSLQAGTVSAPLSAAVLRSLVANLPVWVLFYVLSGAVAAAYVGPLVFGLRHGAWFLTLFLTGPLLAAAILIEARLVGRLAWRVLVRTPRAQKKRRRKTNDKGSPQPTRRKRNPAAPRYVESPAKP